MTDENYCVDRYNYFGSKINSNQSKKQKYKSKFINWFLIPVISGFLIGFFTCGDCFERGDYEDFWSSSIISMIFWFVLAEGNGYLGDRIDERISWIHEPVKRFLVGIVVLFTYTTLASLIVLYFFIEFYIGVDFFYQLTHNWMGNLSLPLSITLFVAIVLHGRGFLMSWRQAAINVEKLKSENIASQYESLKNQVNPHFLFNSLNALSSLVYSDQDRAVKFIRKLSEVYRYVLDHQMDEVVTIKEELEFVESFVFLNKIRFGENLKVTISGFDKSNEQYMIPPLAIQMLLENCFKHNIVSKQNKLEVEIYFEGDSIVVKNNNNPKKPDENSSGLGLRNIKSRYEFLTERPVEINQEEKFFVVKIPLLKTVSS